MIRFVEHSTGGYADRTIENCMKSNLTIAFATDFDTAGERLTKKASYDKYYQVRIHEDLRIQPWAIEQLVRYATNPYRKVKEINIAGEGIYTLCNLGITQEALNSFMIGFIGEFAQRLPAPVKWRSGGQSGIDEAGLIAADFLDFDCTCLAPKGWMFRDKYGVDIKSEHEFVKRFGADYDMSDFL